MRRSGFILVLLLVASACSSGSDVATTSVAPDTTEATAPATTSTAEPATTLPTEPAPTESASCVGTWELDSDLFFEAYNTTATPDQQISFLSGDYIVAWNADGTFTDERVDWTFEFPGIDDAGAMVMNSTGSGEWLTRDGEIIMTGYELIDPRVSMLIDGELFDLPIDSGSTPSGLFDDEATVTCTDTVMTASGSGFKSTLIRIG